MATNLSIRARDLPGLLDQAPAGIKCLSLDCFDTLIWRNTNKPTDVFADLALPGGPDMRIWAEKDARRSTPFRRGSDEVTIDEIYAAMMPHADQATRDAAIAAELAAEARHCYGFAPTLALMRAAKARGLQIVIVSDTYLHEPQLRALIAAAAGDETAALIDRVFVSSAYGRAKAGGLFLQVLPELGVPPNLILHVGDNQAADQHVPARLGINTVHLVQFDEPSVQRLRLEAVAAALLDPAVRATRPAYQPHRPAIALRDQTDAAYALGHDVIGPLMHGFAGWVRDEAEAIAAATGKTPKLLFLLRDGYLPARAFAARFPDWADRIAEVEISRFTARAASLTDEAAVRAYLFAHLASRDWKMLARQLLFMRNEVEQLARASTPERFAEEVLRPSNVQKITHRAGQFADRLGAHLRRHGVNHGDAVMLVDLGYNGSVQNSVETTLNDRFGLSVHGRYLLLREMTLTGLDKKGWLDNRHYDTRALHGLSESIAIVEQLSTLSQGSAVNYKDDGTPVRGDVDVKNAQSKARDRAQAGAVDYVRGCEAGFVRPPVSDTAETRRQAAAAALTRLLFLPVDSEVALFEAFDHDANMGTHASFKLIDPGAAARGLKRRGLFYTKNAMRMYLPGELQRHGLPINLALLASRRFGLDLRKADFDVGAIKLPAIIADDREQALIEVDAVPTHDGYYAVMVPVGEARLTVALPLGQHYELVQIEHIGFTDVEQLMEKDERVIAAQPIHDCLEEIAPGIVRATDVNGLLLVPPPAVAPKGAPLVLTIVFRPLIARAAQGVDAASKAA